MLVNPFLLISNPFFEAYVRSDFIGKFIFIGLFVASICSWTILIYKTWLTYKAKTHSIEFHELFQLQKVNPLGLDCEIAWRNKVPNPFMDLYLLLKKQAIDLLNKNRRFGEKKSDQEKVISYLSPADVDFLESHLMARVALQTKNLEKNLFVLSTVVTLAPFLGLLGTVWGILITFSELQAHHSGGTQNLVLGGLSLALATTVLGLFIAIPALIGYNYLKNAVHDFQTDMESFATEILASVEMQYRKVDLG